MLPVVISLFKHAYLLQIISIDARNNRNLTLELSKNYFAIYKNIKTNFVAIHATKSSIFKVDLAHVQTNILLMYVDRSKVEIRELQRRLQTVLKTDSVKASVRCTSLSPTCVRFVFYWEITEEDVKMAIEKITLVIKEYDNHFRI